MSKNTHMSKDTQMIEDTHMTKDTHTWDDTQTIDGGEIDIATDVCVSVCVSLDVLALPRTDKSHSGRRRTERFPAFDGAASARQAEGL
mmetsp:Transcript_34973/g.51214  ORF Transcript_34973/g.51214 Transcript_34973/m.51214 type:complete len:88 (+) Transcript_34973:275-538(+)